MGFVYLYALIDKFILDGTFVLPLELFLWVPKDAVVKIRLWVLNSIPGPSRVPVSFLAVRTFNLDLVL